VVLELDDKNNKVNLVKKKNSANGVGSYQSQRPAPLTIDKKNNVFGIKSPKSSMKEVDSECLSPRMPKGMMSISSRPSEKGISSFADDHSNFRTRD
jgi:hypothetical protein